MTRSVELVTVPTDRLVELIDSAVAKALDRQRGAAASNAQALSGGQAAKLARCRRSDVGHALASGALLGRRNGRRWTTTVEAVKAWIEAGRPIVVKP